MFEHVTEQRIVELSRNTQAAKWLTLTSWNGRPAKLDLRIWRIENPAEPQPGKGVTLTDDEARILADALNEYLNGSHRQEA